VDGKDLLVEYVEGENSGKALLSRVRMGMHLSEGYIFHTEEARQLTGRNSTILDPAPFIFMMTSERVLLLNGKLDAEFCTVEWETIFLNLIHVELAENLSGTLQQIVIWYLSDLAVSDGEVENAVTGALAMGIDVLRSKCIFAPGSIAKLMVDKIEGFAKRKESYSS
jgi:hypothetical protein